MELIARLTREFAYNAWANREALRSLLGAKEVPTRASVVMAHNTKGERWTNTVADVLTHVALHSSYHRGQIATLLGRAGEAAAVSDYIESVRRGYLEGGWPA